MFENLKARLAEDLEAKKAERKFYIENGFLEGWNETQKVFNDNGIRNYSTETRWNQFQAGKIDREKAVAFAVKRENKKLEKQYASYLAKLEAAENAPDLSYISVNVEYKRSRTWGYNPLAHVITNNQDSSGYASGCGYDKESAAIADAFNKNISILKELYKIKEAGLAAGGSDYSKTAYTHVSNTDICGYGAGYTVLPYFEGGVGADCFWSILKKAGFETRCNYGKHENFYTVSR